MRSRRFFTGPVLQRVSCWSCRALTLGLVLVASHSCVAEVTEVTDCSREGDEFRASGRVLVPVPSDIDKATEVVHQTVRCVFFRPSYRSLCEDEVDVTATFFRGAEDDLEVDFDCSCTTTRTASKWYCQAYVD